MAIDFLKISSELLVSAGGGGIVFGLSRWIGNAALKSQEAEHNRALEGLKARYALGLEELKDVLEKERKRVQAALDHSIFVTRSQFEVEFATLREIFALLADARLQFNGLRPGFRLGRAGETKEDQLKELDDKLLEFSKAFNALLTKVETCVPFYPESLQEPLNKCIHTMSFEINIIRAGPYDAFSSQWYVQADENLKKFNESYRRVVELMRERTRSLSVIPGS